MRDEVNKRRECNQVSLAMKFVPDGTDSFRSSIKEMTFKGCNICQDISSITSSGNYVRKLYSAVYSQSEGDVLTIIIFSLELKAGHLRAWCVGTLLLCHATRALSQ